MNATAAGRAPLGADLRGRRDARRSAVLLLVAPGTADDVWPWALSPLTSRAIGSFLFGIGLAALIAVRDDDPLSFRGAALAYTALGLLELLALNLHIPDLGDRPLATALYAAFWVAGRR